MLNQIVLVGRLARDLKVVNTKEGKKVAPIMIAVPRSFKNQDGEYDTDFIRIWLFDSIAENTCEYCKQGDIVGIKGRIESNGKQSRIIGEKVTFLSSKPREEEE